MQLLLPGIPPIILKKHMLMPVMKKTLLTFEELQSYINIDDQMLSRF